MSSCSFNRQIAREVADKLGVVIVKSHERGIEIRREVCPGGCERHYAIETWIICGGGWIAGNSDVFWLVPVGCVNVQAEYARASEAVRGPFSTRRALESALRTWWEGA